MTALVVQAAGPLSTLQDAGRVGFQRFGVSVAGAADPLLHAVANALVGNGPAEGAIEFTLSGDTLRVEDGGCRLAVAGDVELTIDGATAAPWRSHRLDAGQTVRVGLLRAGLRGYLAVAGGFAVAPVLGSVATHLRSRLGGLSGDRLQAGDRLALRAAAPPASGERRLDPDALPRRGDVLRVVPGPQDDHFTAAGMAAFLEGTYRVGHESDRMGCRLEGPPIAHARGFDITSDGVPPGAVQVPGTGQPIVMLADRQTTGGYPKIACVITPDIAVLAQKRPGQTVRFRAIGRTDAEEAHRRQHRVIAELPGLLREAADGALFASERLLSINLVDGVFDGMATE
ncbi:biotin-dependent carboxyltransferase family protein [Azospirillum sp. ST 5-10]|uniref:5-oxoprolinase subunit C family protein n=1 Tax=unclassified Azospirillum TaxID=2630922 RepID=UPI003F4A2678